MQYRPKSGVLNLLKAFNPPFMLLIVYVTFMKFSVFLYFLGVDHTHPDLKNNYVSSSLFQADMLNQLKTTRGWLCTSSAVWPSTTCVTFVCHSVEQTPTTRCVFQGTVSTYHHGNHTASWLSRLVSMVNIKKQEAVWFPFIVAERMHMCKLLVTPWSWCSDVEVNVMYLKKTRQTLYCLS